MCTKDCIRIPPLSSLPHHSTISTIIPITQMRKPRSELKCLGGESELLGFIGEECGRKRADLSQARMPIHAPFSLIYRDWRNTWRIYGRHASSWKPKPTQKISHSFDFPVSHYFINIGNRNTNELKFMKMSDSPAWILNSMIWAANSIAMCTVFYNAHTWSWKTIKHPTLHLPTTLQ